MTELCWICRKGIPENYGEWHWEIENHNYNLKRCPACKSFFTNPLPDDVTLKKLYEKSFNYGWYHDHYNAKLRDCKIRILEYRNMIGPEVLDFGGGIGYFSEVARKMGFDAITYDPFLNKATSITGKWDTVVALHVLEHSNNLDDIIKQIKSYLKPDGKLILAVPNALSFGYKKLGMHWVWAQPPLLHIFHFTAAGLKMLLERHNFKVLNISYHERWDANIYSDVEHVQFSKLMDDAWAKKPYNSFKLYRKLVAHINTFRRFKGLEKSMIKYCSANDIYAELQVIASIFG